MAYKKYKSNPFFKILLFALIVFGCQNKYDFNKIEIKGTILGNWAYIEVDTESLYIEVYIDSNDIVFQPEKEAGHYGPYNYSLEGDTISYSNMKYKIEKYDCRTMRWVNDRYDITLEKLSVDFPVFSPDLNEGFIIRRCCFLLNKGLITYEEAFNSLKAYNEYLDEFKDVKEEIILMNPPREKKK